MANGTASLGGGNQASEEKHQASEGKRQASEKRLRLMLAPSKRLATMSTLISMVTAKKVPLHMILGGTRRPFRSIENTYKKPTSVSYAYDSSRIASQLDNIAQKLEKIEHQLHQLQRDRPLQEEDESTFNSLILNDSFNEIDLGCNFNYVPPEYHDPELPEFSAIAKRALDTYNLSQVTKLELVEVTTAYTKRGEDYTRIVIEAKPCNPATYFNSELIYQGRILSKEEKFEELEPIKRAKNLDKYDLQIEFPVDHPYVLVAQQAIRSYNLGQHDQDSKLELIKATSVTNRGDKPCVVVEARTCNTPDIEPVIYKVLVSVWDKKVEELIPMEPGELKL